MESGRWVGACIQGEEHVLIIRQAQSHGKATELVGSGSPGGWEKGAMRSWAQDGYWDHRTRTFPLETILRFHMQRRKIVLPAHSLGVAHLALQM